MVTWLAHRAGESAIRGRSLSRETSENKPLFDGELQLSHARTERQMVAGSSSPAAVVMVPCLNEEQTVASVVSRIPRRLNGFGGVTVLVIDDGSSDSTSNVAAHAGAEVVIRHTMNLGLGRAFKDGLKAALLLGADVIVNIDADGQYDPAEISKLVDPIQRGHADIVLGNRQVNGLSHMDWPRKWGNRLASWTTRRLCGLPIADCQTGFRALTKDAAMRLSLNGGYTYTQEMLIQAAQLGLTVEEVPITFSRRSHGTSRLIGSIWRYALNSGTILLKSYRLKPPEAYRSVEGN